LREANRLDPRDRVERDGQVEERVRVVRRRVDNLLEGQVGGPGVVVAPGTSYALVVARDGGVSNVDLPFAAYLAPASTHLILAGPGSMVSGIAPGNYQFTAPFQANRWNAVGAFGGVSSAYTIRVGTAIQFLRFDNPPGPTSTGPRFHPNPCNRELPGCRGACWLLRLPGRVPSLDGLGARRSIR
jgi:hypothetical protein